MSVPTYKELFAEITSIANANSLGTMVMAYTPALINKQLRKQLGIVRACDSYDNALKIIGKKVSEAMYGVEFDVKNSIPKEDDRRRLYELCQVWRSKLLAEADNASADA